MSAWRPGVGIEQELIPDARQQAVLLGIAVGRAGGNIGRNPHVVAAGEIDFAVLSQGQAVPSMPRPSFEFLEQLDLVVGIIAIIILEPVDAERVVRAHVERPVGEEQTAAFQQVAVDRLHLGDGLSLGIQRHPEQPLVLPGDHHSPLRVKGQADPGAFPRRCRSDHLHGIPRQGRDGHGTGHAAALQGQLPLVVVVEVGFGELGDCRCSLEQQCRQDRRREPPPDERRFIHVFEPSFRSPQLRFVHSQSIYTQHFTTFYSR